jgi:hypothetical protein
MRISARRAMPATTEVARFYRRFPTMIASGSNNTVGELWSLYGVL